MTEDAKEQETTALRQLALVDRILGLEAQVAHLKASINNQEIADLLDDVHASATWRAGRVMLAPLSAIKSLIRRGSARGSN
jgi:hypothetical protein